MDFKNLNLLFCIHGRHASNSFRDFADFLGNYEILGSSDLTKEHCTRKIVCFTRDPREKFLSGLDHFFNDLWDGPTLPEDIRPLASTWSQNKKGIPNTNNTKAFRKYLLQKSFWLSNMSLLQKQTTRLNVSRPTTNGDNGYHNIPFDGTTWLFELFYKRTANYHLCDAHMCFTNFSMMCMIADDDLDVVIVDINDLNTFYKSYGYTDNHQTNLNRYQVNQLKQKTYDDNWEIFLEVLDDDVNWYSKTHCGSKEFKNFMDFEYKAYNAVRSRENVNECKSLLREIVWGMVSRKPKDYVPLFEIGYLNMSALVMEVAYSFYTLTTDNEKLSKPDMTSVLNLLYQIMGKEQYNRKAMENVHTMFKNNS